MGWWKRERPAETAVEDPAIVRMQVDRLARIAAAARYQAPPPPPPPPRILLLEKPNYAREFISRFPWTGGVNPYDPIDEVRQRPRQQKPVHWWDYR
jgi:hypothetical protein